MPTTPADLQAHVTSRCAGLGLPSWPDPHPDGAPARDEEYSRLTDPGRYRIAHVRGRVWAAVLEEALGARVETLAPTPAGSGDAPAFDRGTRVVPRAPGALPLLLLERDVPAEPGGAPLAVLHVAVGRPDVVVAAQPDCGCDACDSGSEDLLAAVDSVVGQVVTGPFVVLRGPGWTAQWYPEGGVASSDGRGPAFDAAMALCRRLSDGQDVRLPDGAEAFVGRSWLV